MLDVQEIAIEAIKARYDKNQFYNGFLQDLETAGCSPTRIAVLLERAKARVPHPQAPRALRILKRAAKSAARGDGQRAKELRAVAIKLIGEDEVVALTEEHRLSFVVIPATASTPERVRCGFAS